MEVEVVMTVAQGYARCEADFRRHYQQYCAEDGGSYERYRPVYRYGYDLGRHKHYGSHTWAYIETEARTFWEVRNPGTWEQYKAAITYGWETASGQH